MPPTTIVQKTAIDSATLEYPSEWTIQTLNQLSSGIGVGCVINPSTYFDDSGTVPMLLGSNIQENKIDWNSARRITQDSTVHLSASRLNAGDLVTVRVGEPGITAVIPEEWDGCNCASMMVIRQSHRFDSLWLCYVMNSRIGRSEVDQVKYGSAQKQFNISHAIDFSFPVPPLSEQRAIATALSDVDELIGALEKLIAKKRAIKLATMQQLLTGKTRLPGFSGEWEETSLGQVGSTYGGLSGKRKADFGGGDGLYVPFLNVLENVVIDPHQLERVRLSPGESQNTVKKGDVLFNGTSETPEDVAIGAYVDAGYEGLYLNSFCFGFRIQKPSALEGLFLSYLFRSNVGRKLMYALAQGATRYNMSKSKFLELKLQLPGGPEQRAIAAVLSDMDAEITALEARRDKTKAIKQGMMQALLTGRVRLVEPEAEAG